MEEQTTLLSGKRNAITTYESEVSVDQLLKSLERPTTSPPPPVVAQMENNSSASATKRKDAKSQEQQQLHLKRQKTLGGEIVLSNHPANRCKIWEGKAQKARKTLSEARQTRCFYDLEGSCRDRDNCMFMHSSYANYKNLIHSSP